MHHRWHPSLRYLSLLLAFAFMAGCSNGLRIDTSHQALGHDSRVQYVILHYTSSNAARALNTLTRGEVSSHYLINDNPPTIYRLVDEDRRAWHAGDSSWQGRTWLNTSSIGIEIVHPGYRDTADGRHWYPWNQQQIEQLIPLLQDILQRHDLPPERVLGHSDIAPQRKVDPGPLFPWQQLAEAGVAIWPDTAQVAQYEYLLAGQTPPLAWFEATLQRFGYNVVGRPGQTNTLSNVIAAFQMRFRPAHHDGEPDAQTAAILAAMVPDSFNQISQFGGLTEAIDELTPP
ncbi:MAG: N-acetylmuramoyl-L-alanine amidase [Pseudomonas sp.]